MGVQVQGKGLGLGSAALRIFCLLTSPVFFFPLIFGPYLLLVVSWWGSRIKLLCYQSAAGCCNGLFLCIFFVWT